jgi:hypothetical protein
VALKRCRYQFTRLDGHGTPEPTKRAAVSLYGYGLSFNTVAHLLGTTAQSVLRWVCRYFDHHCSKPSSRVCGPSRLSSPEGEVVGEELSRAVSDRVASADWGFPVGL